MPPTLYPEIARRGIVPDIVTDQTSAHDLVYGYVPKGMTPRRGASACATSGPAQLMAASRASIVDHVRAMLAFQQAGAEVFDNGNLIRTQAKQGGVENAFDIPIFTEAYLRPLFARAIGPFRWMALSGDPDDIRRIDDRLLADVPRQPASSPTGSGWPASTCRSRACRRASPGSATASARQLALAVNAMVRRRRRWPGPVAFSRDHLDAGAMAHPNIMTEKMKDGSDAIADWPLLDAMLLLLVDGRSRRDPFRRRRLCRLHDRAGVTLIADGTDAADERLEPRADQRHLARRHALCRCGLRRVAGRSSEEIRPVDRSFRRDLMATHPAAR